MNKIGHKKSFLAQNKPGYLVSFEMAGGLYAGSLVHLYFLKNYKILIIIFYLLDRLIRQKNGKFEIILDIYS